MFKKIIFITCIASGIVFFTSSLVASILVFDKIRVIAMNKYKAVFGKVED